MARTDKKIDTGGAARPPTDRAMQIGTRIKAAREKGGLSQHGLALQLGITAGAVGQWELGANAPQMQRLIKVAEILGVSVNHLLIGESAEERGIAQTTSEKHLLHLLRSRPGNAAAAALYVLENWSEDRSNEDPVECLAIAEAWSKLDPEIRTAVTAMISGLRDEKMPTADSGGDPADLFNQAASFFPMWSSLAPNQQAALMVVLRHFQNPADVDPKEDHSRDRERSGPVASKKSRRRSVENSHS